MEKKCRRRSKFIAVVLTTIVLFTTLTTQIFADFAGDGTSSGIPIYSETGVRSIEIEQAGGGSTSAIDNIIFSPIPMYEDGDLISEIARGTYGTQTGQYYRYTTQITRSEGTIYQKFIFDTPLFDTATRLTVRTYSPIVTNDDADYDLRILTNNTNGTATVVGVRVSYTSHRLDTDISQTDTGVSFESSLISTDVAKTDSSTSAFPYWFTLWNYIDDPDLVDFVTDLVVEYDVIVNSSGVLSLSIADNYTTNSPFIQILPIYERVSNIIVEEVVPPPVYIDDVPFAETIITSFADIAEIELFGAFSIGDLLWAFVGIMALIAFLKLYAGG